MKVKLTSKQDAFVREYSKDFNATKAALRAGYASSSAYQRGYELVKNSDIQQRLSSLGLVGLYTLENVAKNGKNEIARVYASKTLVEMVYGKPSKRVVDKNTVKIKIVNAI